MTQSYSRDRLTDTENLWSPRGKWGEGWEINQEQGLTYAHYYIQKGNQQGPTI